MSGLPEKLEALEPTQRWMICGLAVVLLAGIGYYLHSMNAERLETLGLEVEELRQSVQKHQAVATRLDDLKARLAALDEALKVAITLLPETREIPELLTQISQLGSKAGLEFRLFKPEPEKKSRLLRRSAGESDDPRSLPRLGAVFRSLIEVIPHCERHGYQDQPGQREWRCPTPHDQLSPHHLPISGAAGSRCEESCQTCETLTHRCTICSG
jgi:hypothetical protein